jgi:signal transduction histidine kinase
VEDNGRGFNHGVQRERTGARDRLGLAGMRERVAQVGGTLMIESALDRGTSVFVRIPLGEYSAEPAT